MDMKFFPLLLICTPVYAGEYMQVGAAHYQGKADITSTSLEVGYQGGWYDVSAGYFRATQKAGKYVQTWDGYTATASLHAQLGSAPFTAFVAHQINRGSDGKMQSSNGLGLTWHIERAKVSLIHSPKQDGRPELNGLSVKVRF